MTCLKRQGLRCFILTSWSLGLKKQEEMDKGYSEPASIFLLRTGWGTRRQAFAWTENEEPIKDTRKVLLLKERRSWPAHCIGLVKAPVTTEVAIDDDLRKIRSGELDQAYLFTRCPLEKMFNSFNSPLFRLLASLITYLIVTRKQSLTFIHISLWSKIYVLFISWFDRG